MKSHRAVPVSSGQRGYSLAEVLVAMAVFTIIIVAALMIYDRSNRVFTQSVQAGDMQQSTRVAFQKLVSDVRLAGFDFDRDGVPFGSLALSWTKTTSYQAGTLVQPSSPNGHTYLCSVSGVSGGGEPLWPLTPAGTVTDGTVKWQEAGNVQYQQPDEQIEYAGPAAVTIRVNSNYETATSPCKPGVTDPCENGREPGLESGQFPLVTTDNNEIVTYALVSSKASANTGKVEFYADLNRPRKSNPVGKAKESLVSITGVDLTNNNPPYTLYRYTLLPSKDDTTGKYEKVAIADNIRRMTFHYYTDLSGTKEIPCPTCTPALTMPLGAGQYDPGDPYKTIDERDTRAKIKSVRIELVGMNPNPDINYKDADTVAPNYRKYELDTLVVPRNLGRRGMKEFATAAPSKPHIDTVCAGACNAVFATWEAPTGGGDVDSYSIVYDVGGCTGPVDTLSFTYSDTAGANLSGYAYSKITPGKKYRFAVQAVNKYGAQLSDNCIEATVLNTTTPSAPNDLDASGGASGKYATIANGVQLYWSPVGTNAKVGTTCNDGSTKDETAIPFGESIAYVIYKSSDPSFKTTDAGVTKITPSTTTTPAGLLTYTDTTIGNCTKYYYRIQAIASPCGLTGNDAMNQGGSISLAQSKEFPANSSAPIEGWAKSAQKPAVPTSLGLKSLSCPGAGNICDVTFSWAPVTTDTTGAPMNVANYSLKVYQYDLATGAWNPIGSPVTTSGGITQATATGLDKSSVYRVTVAATQTSPCLNSDESAPVYWPCNWTGGNVVVAPLESFGGSGVTGDPWIIQSPASLIVKTDSNVQSVTATVTEGGVTKGVVTANGPNTTFSLTLPATSDGVEAKVKISVVGTGANACTINGNYFVLDAAAPACQLRDDNTDDTVVTYTKGASAASSSTVNITLKNLSSDILKLKKISVTMNLSGGNKLDKVTVPGALPISLACSGTSAKADFSSVSPAPTPIAANQTNYAASITFTKSPNTIPLTSICIVYQTPTGDIKRCSIFPNQGVCTEAAGACQ